MPISCLSPELKFHLLLISFVWFLPGLSYSGTNQVLRGCLDFIKRGCRIHWPLHGIPSSNSQSFQCIAIGQSFIPHITTTLMNKVVGSCRN
ncbi:hypothetical protein EDC04DRAFT_2810235 [Pisolithus marmoratus]|nr:hypothetical protein EDC04DRAFT_2810235 [Pisolithus marmoratus]